MPRSGGHLNLVKGHHFHKTCFVISSERDLLLEKLSDLEDESAAVKVSLIQLLQEKSATNKTLALENCRLSQRVCVGVCVCVRVWVCGCVYVSSFISLCTLSRGFVCTCAVV